MGSPSTTSLRECGRAAASLMVNRPGVLAFAFTATPGTLERFLSDRPRKWHLTMTSTAAWGLSSNACTRWGPKPRYLEPSAAGCYSITSSSRPVDSGTRLGWNLKLAASVA